MSLGTSLFIFVTDIKARHANVMSTNAATTITTFNNNKAVANAATNIKQLLIKLETWMKSVYEKHQILYC